MLIPRRAAVPVLLKAGGVSGLRGKFIHGVEVGGRSGKVPLNAEELVRKGKQSSFLSLKKEKEKKSF